MREGTQNCLWEEISKPGKGWPVFAEGQFFQWWLFLKTIIINVSFFPEKNWTLYFTSRCWNYVINSLVEIRVHLVGFSLRLMFKGWLRVSTSALSYPLEFHQLLPRFNCHSLRSTTHPLFHFCSSYLLTFWLCAVWWWWVWRDIGKGKSVSLSGSNNILYRNHILCSHCDYTESLVCHTLYSTEIFHSFYFIRDLRLQGKDFLRCC